MRRDIVAGLTTAGVVTATAAFAVLAGTGPSQAGGVPSSAYGAAATGAFPFEKTPYIESSDGRRHTNSQVELPENPVLSLRAVTTTAADSSASVEIIDAGVGKGLFEELPEPPKELQDLCDQLPLASDAASGSAAGGLSDGLEGLPKMPGGRQGTPKAPPLDLGIPGVPPLDQLPKGELPDLCRLLQDPPDSIANIDTLNIWCKGDEGGVDVGTVRVLGQEVELPSTDPNTEIPAEPLANITINRQTENADGSFTVDGVVVNLGGAQEIVLGSATCGNYVEDREDPTPKPDPEPKPDPTPQAPRPAPIPTHHPVTG